MGDRLRHTLSEHTHCSRTHPSCPAQPGQPCIVWNRDRLLRLLPSGDIYCHRANPDQANRQEGQADAPTAGKWDNLAIENPDRLTCLKLFFEPGRGGHNNSLGFRTAFITRGSWLGLCAGTCPFLQLGIQSTQGVQDFLARFPLEFPTVNALLQVFHIRL